MLSKNHFHSAFIMCLSQDLSACMLCERMASNLLSMVVPCKTICHKVVYYGHYVRYHIALQMHKSETFACGLEFWKVFLGGRKGGGELLNYCCGPLWSSLQQRKM